MFESIIHFFKRIVKAESREETSRNAAKERLHLVLMQDRANVSADFLEMMKQEIIEVIKKYIDVDENAIDVKLTNKTNEDGTNGAPALYANIPIISIKKKEEKAESKPKEEKKEEVNLVEDKQETEKDKEEKTENKKEEKKVKVKKEKKIEKKKEEAIQEEAREEVKQEEKEKPKVAKKN